MAELVLRTSGFALYFFSILLALFVFVLYVSIIQSAEQKNLVLLFGSIILFGWVMIYLIVYLLGNKIVLTSKELVIRAWKQGMYPGKGFFPKTKTTRISLKNIKGIILRKARYFDEKEHEFFKKQLKKVKKTQLYLPYSPLALKMWTAVKHTPLVYILERSGKKHLITTKPFSKKGFFRLLKELGKNKIQVLFK